MSLERGGGSVTITTGAVGSTFPVTGLTGFGASAKKFVYLSWSGRATDGQSETNSRFGNGAFISTTARRAYTSQCEHGPVTTATDHARYDDCCVAVLTLAGATNGKADIDAELSDGFRLIIDAVFSTALVVKWAAVWGSDIQETEIVDLTEPAATGGQDYATAFPLDTGLDDKFVLFMSNASAVFGTPAVNSNWGLGAAAGNTIVNAVTHSADRDAQATTQTYGYGRLGECIANLRGDNVTSRASLTAWLSTGFRLNWAEIDTVATWGHSALIVKGGRWEIGSAVTSTGTSNQTEPTTYIPKFLLASSVCRAESTVDVVTGGDERSVGVATGTGPQQYVSHISIDGAVVGDIGIASGADDFYANQSTDATIVIEGLARVLSFDASPPGFTWVMSDADPSANFFWYLLGADATPVPVVIPWQHKFPNIFQ